jgi:NitT/TauT family transport system ATP-binding protein
MEISVDHLTKVWGHPEDDGAVVALRDLSHTFRSERITCVIGPSGCGKSTMLEIIGGIEQPTSGQVRITDPANPGARYKSGEHSVMVWQNFNLLPWRTVLQNVVLGLEARGVGKVEREEQARLMLDRVGLAHFVDKRPGQLSGGMRQRVALARSLVVEPKVLLLDEPFGALDAQTRLLMQEELLRLVEGTGRTVIFVTHSIEEALLLGDDVVVMSARPATIVDQFDVPLPRPRKIAEHRHEPVFGELFDRAYEQLRVQVQRATELESRSV